MQRTSLHGFRPLSRDIIKYFAMFTMTLNHLRYAGIIADGAFGTFATDLGYFTFIAMTYFLVEGFDYTHDRRAYGRRLLLFAVISEIPFCLAFSSPGSPIELTKCNVLFNLCICYQVIVLLERSHHGENVRVPLLLLFLLSLYCDWSMLGPFFTTAFYKARHGGWGQIFPVSEGGAAAGPVFSDAVTGRRDSEPESVLRHRELNAWLLCLAGFVLVNLIEGLSHHPVHSIREFLLAADPEALIGPLLAFIAIYYGYNGKQSLHGRRFSKWFFYIFYPAHLSVIAIVRLIMK